MMSANGWTITRNIFAKELTMPVVTLCASTASRDHFWSCAKSVFTRGILWNKSRIQCPPALHRNLCQSLYIAGYLLSILSQCPCFHIMCWQHSCKSPIVYCMTVVVISFPAQLFSLEIYRKMSFESEKKLLTGDINETACTLTRFSWCTQQCMKCAGPELSFSRQLLLLTYH